MQARSVAPKWRKWALFFFSLFLLRYIVCTGLPPKIEGLGYGPDAIGVDTIVRCHKKTTNIFLLQICHSTRAPLLIQIVESDWLIINYMWQPSTMCSIMVQTNEPTNFDLRQLCQPTNKYELAKPLCSPGTLDPGSPGFTHNGIMEFAWV